MRIEKGMGGQVTALIEAQRVTVWPADAAYVVSGEDSWLPGVFDDPVAALVYGAMLTPDEQVILHDASEDGRISIEDVCEVVSEKLGSRSS